MMTKEEMWDRLNTVGFPCIRPDVVREWFREDPDDDRLAEALAQVCNRVGILCAESAESNDRWLEYIFCDWDELEGSVVARLADDVRVGIVGQKVELTIIKKF